MVKSLSIFRLTQLVFIGTRLLGTPAWSLLTMLAFILYKNCHLTPLQITLIIALKPTSSLLSPYWSQAIYQRPDRLIPNLMGAQFLRHLPFLFVPWIDSVWYLIFSFGLYMTLSRATIPAWMELFKYNLPKVKQEEMVAFGTMIDYLGAALLTVALGVTLDHFQEQWKWLFALTATLGLFSSLLFFLLPSLPPLSSPSEVKMQKKFTQPWRQVWQLMRQNKEFTLFQMGFMLGGAGLMIMQPALPQFFIDTLNLSFTKMCVALSFCKGIGVALTSSLWTRLFRKVTIFQLSALVTFFAMLFPFLLFASKMHLLLLYLAYAFYGIMQAGSELSWHMSGLVFAQEKDSSLFSVTNVLTVGVRGCLVPALGALLLPSCHAWGVMFLGALLCLLASAHFLFHSQRQSIEESKVKNASSPLS